MQLILVIHVVSVEHGIALVLHASIKAFALPAKNDVQAILYRHVRVTVVGGIILKIVMILMDGIVVVIQEKIGTIHVNHNVIVVIYVRKMEVVVHHVSHLVAIL